MRKGMRIAMVIAILYVGLVGCAPASPYVSAVSLAADETKHGITVPVLAYHSIGVEPGNIYVLNPDVFARQMDDLAAQHYTPLTLADFVSIIEHKQAPPHKPVLLTFDDGYANNAEVALPILQRHGFPATLFLSTGLIGQSGYLSWQQVEQLNAAGWAVMPHSVTHPHLPQLSPKEQREEITDSRRRIEQHLGNRADIFAYPYGEYDETTLSLLKEAGYRYAFTIHPGWASSTQPPLKLNRIMVYANDDWNTWQRKLHHSAAN